MTKRYMFTDIGVELLILDADKAEVWLRQYHIIDALHFTHFSSSSSNGQSRSPNAQPYSFDDYYYYDYDYEIMRNMKEIIFLSVCYSASIKTAKN